MRETAVTAGHSTHAELLQLLRALPSGSMLIN